MHFDYDWVCPNTIAYVECPIVRVCIARTLSVRDSFSIVSIHVVMPSFSLIVTLFCPYTLLMHIICYLHFLPTGLFFDITFNVELSEPTLNKRLRQS